MDRSVASHALFQTFKAVRILTPVDSEYASSTKNVAGRRSRKPAFFELGMHSAGASAAPAMRAARHYVYPRRGRDGNPRDHRF